MSWSWIRKPPKATPILASGIRKRKSKYAKKEACLVLTVDRCPPYNVSDNKWSLAAVERCLAVHHTWTTKKDVNCQQAEMQLASCGVWRTIWRAEYADPRPSACQPATPEKAQANRCRRAAIVNLEQVRYLFPRTLASTCSSLARLGRTGLSAGQGRAGGEVCVDAMHEAL